MTDRILIGDLEKPMAAVESRSSAQKKAGKPTQLVSRSAGRFDGPATNQYQRFIN